MSSRLIVNCALLVNTRTQSSLLRGPELAVLPCLENAWLLVEDDEIAAYGSMSDLPSHPNTPRIDASGQFILPAWCDSHTHLVFAGSREEEFVDKIRGLSYAEINARGGGILNSARKLGAASEDHLFNEAWKRLEDAPGHQKMEGKIATIHKSKLSRRPHLSP